MNQAEETIALKVLPVNNTAHDLLLQMVNEETGMRGFLITGQEKTLSAYLNGRKQLGQDFAFLEAHCPSEWPLTRLIQQQAKPQTQGLEATFAHLIELVRTGKINEARAHINDAKAQFKGFRDTMAQIDHEIDHLIRNGHRAGRAAYGQTRTWVLSFTVFAVLLAGCVIWYVARVICEPLACVLTAAKRLAVGEVDQKLEMTSRDEVGQVAEAFRSLIAYQQEMAGVAEAMAVGDLNCRVKPKSDRDTLGHAFTKTISYQQEMAEVAETMTLGDLSRSVQPKSDKDTLGHAFTRMVAYQKEMAGAAEAMSTGDLSRSVQPKSDKDTLGHAFTRMVAYQKQMAEVAEAIAEGNLTRTVEPKSDQDVLGHAFANMVANLSQLVARASAAADSIAEASTQLATGSEDLSQRTTEQASSLEETASSMEEMTATIKQNADNARQANQLAAQAKDVAEKGGEVVGNVVSSMEEINASSKRIADIISVIDEIAFQTNLLALNASVEAARVGEQGRGFAVVATEVRNLAGRSAAAAKEIKTLVADSVGKVQEGSALVDRSGQTLIEIVSAVKKVADIIAEISAASQEQSAGIEQVNKAILQMDQITQQNAALVEEASAATQSMNLQAKDLQQVVNQFQLDAGYLQRAQQAVDQSYRPMEQTQILSATGTDGSARKGGSGRKATKLVLSSHDKPGEGGHDESFEEF